MLASKTSRKTGKQTKSEVNIRYIWNRCACRLYYACSACKRLMHIMSKSMKFLIERLFVAYFLRDACAQFCWVYWVNYINALLCVIMIALEIPNANCWKFQISEWSDIMQLMNSANKHTLNRSNIIHIIMHIFKII